MSCDLAAGTWDGLGVSLGVPSSGDGANVSEASGTKDTRKIVSRSSCRRFYPMIVEPILVQDPSGPSPSWLTFRTGTLQSRWTRRSMDLIELTPRPTRLAYAAVSVIESEYDMVWRTSRCSPSTRSLFVRAGPRSRVHTPRSPRRGQKTEHQRRRTLSVARGQFSIGRRPSSAPIHREHNPYCFPVSC